MANFISNSITRCTRDASKEKTARVKLQDTNTPKHPLLKLGKPTSPKSKQTEPHGGRNKAPERGTKQN
jgi:hypothetical protein